MINIKKASCSNDFKIIENLAAKILPGVYDHIISAEQRAYFTAEFQTEKAIAHQVSIKNRTYYLLIYQNLNVGYMGFDLNKDTLHLSKLYILKAFRGKKIGKMALNFLFELGIKENVISIELMVNVENFNAIKAYKNYGFKIIKQVENSFPNGFKVRDYKMKKDLSN